MKGNHFFLLLCCLLCCIPPVQAQFTLQELALGNPITYKNLQLYPVIANAALLEANAKIGNYATLEETMQNRLVQIAEQEPEGQPQLQSARWLTMQNNYPIVPDKNRLLEEYEPVFEANTFANTDTNAIYSPFDNAVLDPEIVRLSQLEAQTDRLFITNLSEDTIFLMAGEVIQGGKQDRVIAQNMLLPPNTRNAGLPVFCVEKNRWSYHKDKNPCFTDYICIADATLRRTVQLNAKQEEVWNVVNRATAAQNAQTATQTYAALQNNTAFTRLSNAYEQFLNPVFAQNSQIIGIVAVTGNRIAGADIFANHTLFSNQLPSLLRSYAANAILYGSTPSLNPMAVSAGLEQYITPNGINRQAFVNNGKIFETNGQVLHLNWYD